MANESASQPNSDEFSCDVVDPNDCVINSTDNDVHGLPQKKERQISQRQFYRYRMALRVSDKDAFHWLWFARRLAEYFVISVANRVERDEMDYVRKIQEKKNYRQVLAREFIEALQKGITKYGPNAKLGRIFFMPSSFAGSRQYYQEKYAELMTMVQHLGNPTWYGNFNADSCIF